MTSLSELLGRPITPEAKDSNKAKVRELTAPIPLKEQKPHRQYEVDVFNFLLAHKEQLGIKTVMKFSALRVDGAVELIDGKRFAVEMKFRMNWLKACQAEWEFRRFLTKKDRMPFPVEGGIVFFEKFSGDWGRKAEKRWLLNGWSNWYRGHSEVEGLRLDLLQLRDGNLQCFPIAAAITAQVKSLTAEEARRRLLEGSRCRAANQSLQQTRPG
jgi:hypothetical protein